MIEFQIFNDLQRFLFGRGVGTLLRKVAPQQPGAAQAPAPAQPQKQPQQQPQQRQKPEEILRDLLQGLGRPRQ